MASPTSAPRLLVRRERPPVPERAALFLVGGYDGSGNYGDMVQLEAALALLARAVPEVSPIPVIDIAHRACHAELAATSPVLDSMPPAYFDASLAPAPEGFAPLELDDALACGGVYLYGGGYLNPWWGARKLEMARVAEAAVLAAGVPCLAPLASGVQIDATWVAGVDGRDAELLRRTEPLGVRDEASIPAFASRALLTGDDAVGVLAPFAGTAAPEPARVNVHLQDRSWVADDPQAHLAFVADLLEQWLARRGDVAIQPVIAYDDARISERPLADWLAAHPVLGPRVAGEPVVLRPGDLAASLAVLGRAQLTISCSYHVALTSDLLGVPAALIASNPYYEQKVSGLAADFGLPVAFTIRPSAPAAEAAASLDAALAEDLRPALATGANRVVARRPEAEAAIATTLSSAVEQARRDPEAILAGLRAHYADAVARVDALREELGRRDQQRHENEAEMERLHARIDELETTLDEERREAARLQHSHHAMASSRTWRLTEPLRRAARALRQRGA